MGKMRADDWAYAIFRAVQIVAVAYVGTSVLGRILEKVCQ